MKGSNQTRGKRGSRRTRVKDLRDKMVGQRAYQPRVQPSKSAVPGRQEIKRKLRGWGSGNDEA